MTKKEKEKTTKSFDIIPKKRLKHNVAPVEKLANKCRSTATEQRKRE